MDIIKKLKDKAESIFLRFRDWLNENPESAHTDFDGDRHCICKCGDCRCHQNCKCGDCRCHQNCK